MLFVDACSSVMRKTACNHYCSVQKTIASPSPFPKLRVNGRGGERERRRQTRRKFPRGGGGGGGGGGGRSPQGALIIRRQIGKTSHCPWLQGREGGRSDPSPPVSSPSLLHPSAVSLVICITPIQSNCLPLFHLPAPLNIYNPSFLSPSSRLSVSIILLPHV